VREGGREEVGVVPSPLKKWDQSINLATEINSHFPCSNGS